MKPGDCAQVAALHQHLDHSGWNEAMWMSALEKYPCSWILLTNNQVQSYICYQTAVPQIELLNLGVTAGFQGQGVAYQLIKATFELLPAFKESVFLEVRRSNIPAIGLYEKLDFECIGRRPDYYPAPGGGREDALIYKYDFKS